MLAPRRALLILAIAILAIAVPSSLVAGAAGDPGQATASKKGKKKKKKHCKKGFKKIKGKCKKKPRKPKPAPTNPALSGIVPQIGEYDGGAIMSQFRLTSYTGAQGRVELLATVPVAGCSFKTSLAMLIGDRGEPATVNGNKFDFRAQLSDEFGGYTQHVEGTWTSSTTVQGTIQLTETYDGETCDTGVQPFTATAK